MKIIRCQKNIRSKYYLKSVYGYDRISSVDIMVKEMDISVKRKCLIYKNLGTKYE